MKKRTAVFGLLMVFLLGMALASCNGPRSAYKGKRGKDCNCPNSM